MENAQKEIEPLKTAKELANALNISYWTVWKWTKEGKIPTIRIGPKRIFYRLSTVQQWLSEMERASVEKPEEKSIQYGVLRRIDG